VDRQRFQVRRLLFWLRPAQEVRAVCGTTRLRNDMGMRTRANAPALSLGVWLLLGVVDQANATTYNCSLFPDGLDDPSIVTIDCYEGNFDGVFPEEIFSLPLLKTLKLTNNRLTGELPSDLSNLTALEDLELFDNSLTGQLPSKLPPKLVNLILYGNELRGSIPAWDGPFDTLTQLRINDNKLEGSVPEELASFTNLDYFVIAGNQLTGCIPDALVGICDSLDCSESEQECGTLNVCSANQACTSSPTFAPSTSPSKAPSSSPTPMPTGAPSSSPTVAQTEAPTPLNGGSISSARLTVLSAAGFALAWAWPQP